MAGISVTIEMLHDTRYFILAKAVGIADPDLARMKCIRVYHECLHRETHNLTPDEVDAAAGITGFGICMVNCGLAEFADGGRLYIKGTRGRIEWLKTVRSNAKENGKKGGRPPKQADLGLTDENQGRLSDQNQRRFDLETDPNNNNNNKSSSSSSGSGSEGLRSVALRLWEAQEDLRLEVVEGARRLKVTEDRLERIIDRLEDGNTEEDCMHVLRVCQHEARTEPKWFNGETNWRKDNFDRQLGKAVPTSNRVQEETPRWAR